MESEVATRSGTTAEWVASTIVLGLGELGVDVTTGEVRVGNGVDQYEALRPVGNLRRGRATLVAGTVTVALASVTATTIVLLTAQALGTVTVAKPLAVTARSNGVSFTITSSDNTDTSVVGWVAIEV